MRTRTTLFAIVNSIVLMLIVIDLPFYGFNGKRMTRDVLGQTAAGWRELPTMMVNYWWATLLFVAAMILIVRTANRHARKEIPATPLLPRLGIFIVLTAVLFFIGRGGWQYQGLSPAHAADHVGPGWAPVVTNSAFTFCVHPRSSAANYLPEMQDRAPSPARTRSPRPAPKPS